MRSRSILAGMALAAAAMSISPLGNAIDISRPEPTRPRGPRIGSGAPKQKKRKRVDQDSVRIRKQFRLKGVRP